MRTGLASMDNSLVTNKITKKVGGVLQQFRFISFGGSYRVTAVWEC